MAITSLVIQLRARYKPLCHYKAYRSVNTTGIIRHPIYTLLPMTGIGNHGMHELNGLERPPIHTSTIWYSHLEAAGSYNVVTTY